MSAAEAEATAAVPGQPPSAARRLALVGVPGAVGAGRDFVRQALTDWHWFAEHPDPTRQPLAADILLVVSELLANAYMHAGGPVELIVQVGDGALRLEVADGDPRPPMPSSPRRSGVPGGHGLHIIEQISDRWGVDFGETGKTVWAEVDTARLEADVAADRVEFAPAAERVGMRAESSR